MKLNLVKAAQGLQWVKLGARVFFKQPLAMTGLFFMFMAMMSLLTAVPVLGFVLAMTVLPACTLGMMAATREVILERFPMPLILLTAFRAGKDKAFEMLKLGALYAICFMLAMAASALVDGGSFAQMYLGGQAPSSQTLASGEFQNAMWVFIALHLPLSLLFWHAPALIFWHDEPLAKSLFASWLACWKNLRAYMIFAGSWVAVMLLVVVILTFLSSLLPDFNLASVLMLPALLWVASMFFASLFFTFSDCFLDRHADTTQA